MRLRFPLYAQILSWFFLNLLLLGLVFYVFFTVQFRLGLDSLLMGRAGDRIEAVTDLLAAELGPAPRTEWDGILGRFTAAYHVAFHLFRLDGTQLAGPAVELPSPVRDKLVVRRGPPDPPPRADRRPPMPGPGGPPGQLMPAPGAPGTHPKFMLHTTGPSRFWVGVRLALPAREQRAMEPAMPPPDGPREERPGRDERRFEPVVLLAVSTSLSGGGLFFDAQPWLVFAFGAVLFSMLLWIPLVRGLTRSIAQMTRAAEQIAEGQFDVQVADRRPDELGRLGQAINRMAARLAGFVTGQKRFLGDVAHELCSPIARTQMALGILEQRAAAAEQPYLDDLREEVQQMSTLVNELLSFSKAGLRRGQIPLRPVNLAELARRVVARENRDGRPIELNIAPDLEALAEPELLARALGNVVRNALHHAGAAGPIAVEATADAAGVTLAVVDSGPGVPEAALEKLFDPFYRVEASRSRETGGAGLGLAIVKTCIEACQGTVRAVNRQPNGLRVELHLGGVDRPADSPAKG